MRQNRKYIYEEHRWRDVEYLVSIYDFTLEDFA